MTAKKHYSYKLQVEATRVLCGELISLSNLPLTFVMTIYVTKCVVEVLVIVRSEHQVRGLLLRTGC